MLPSLSGNAQLGSGMVGPRRSRPGTAKGGKGGDKADKPQVAVALSYELDKTESAPVVVASGRGHLADRILEAAKEAGVPIRKDSDLVEILAATEIGDQIPVEAFIAVAEILSFIYRKNGKLPPGVQAAGAETLRPTDKDGPR